MGKKIVAARVYRDADLPISDGVETAIGFNKARFDYGTLHTSLTRLVAPLKGIYYINAQCIWGSNIDRTDSRCLDIMWQLTLKLNGAFCIATDRQAYSSWTSFNHCCTIWEMEQDDYIEMVVFWYKPPELDMQSWVKRAEHLDSPEFMMAKL